MRRAILILVLSSAVSPAAAEDWPCWRGPRHDGISAEKTFLTSWPKDGPPVAWKGSVGIGYSATTIAQGRLYTMGHKDGKDTIHCLDALTGKSIWSHSYAANLGDLYFDGGPTSTPTVDEGAVYALSRWGDLFRFDAATGKIAWQRNVKKENGRVPGWGFASSPLVHGKLLILNVGKTGLALEKETGKVVWASPDEEAGYSTPVPFRRGEEWFVAVSSGLGFAAVNLMTGKPVWEHRWLTKYGVNAADPILVGDEVFISSGYNKGATLLKVSGAETKEVWRNKNMRNQMNPCVLLDGFLYGIDGDTTGTPVLRCLELKTGAIRWTQKGIGPGGVTAADGKLIVLTENGELSVTPASPEGFKPMAKAKVIEPACWTVPVLANGRIYCRNAAGDVVCVDVRAK